MNARRLWITVPAAALFGAAAPAGAVVLPPATTFGPCGSFIPASQACSSPANAAIAWSSFADLATQTAGVRIDMSVPGAALFDTSVNYYVQLYSSTGVLPSERVPIFISAVGNTSVGGSGGTFNNNKAAATVKVFDTTLYACSGFGCPRNTPTDFGGTFSTSVAPNSSGSGIDPNVWQVTVRAQAETNTSAPNSFAYAFADPVITIDPGWAALHPEVSLVFSPNLPVPEAPPLAMLAAGLAVLALRRARAGDRERAPDR